MTFLVQHQQERTEFPDQQSACLFARHLAKVEKTEVWVFKLVEVAVFKGTR